MSEVLTITGEEWHALRARHVGGSEIAALFDAQPDYALGLHGLWLVKSGRAPAPEVDNPRTRWGNRLEEAIAYGCAEQEGWKIRKGGHFTDLSCRGLGATLDFVIEGGEEGRSTPGALEIKNVDYRVHKQSWVDGEPPLHILLQLQHQLACSGFTWGAVGELIGGNDLRIYRYEARTKLIAKIRQKVAAFWKSIDEGNEPPVDNSTQTGAILRAMNSPVRDEIADMEGDNELPEICSGLLHAAAKRKEIEREEQGFKNRLIEKLGTAKKARSQGFFISTVVTPEKAPRAALPGEMIPGRKEARRYEIKEANA
ncbi:YqaJ viral recombinase family protein [Asaia sp. HN128]|uniref:YqaJ viral recombinase family nuclease n=1 Tax=Asaia sp. HN128 TaxID=3081234 RepID=UPI003015FFB5